MSLLNNGTLANPTTPYYALATESASNWYKFPSQNGEILLVDASGVQMIHSIDANLYYNNELLAKAGDLSNVADWSLYPQLSTIQGNNQAIVDVSDLQSSTIHTSTLFSLTAQMSTATLSGSISANTATIGAGLGSIVSISGGGITASGVISGSGLATTSGLNMTNTGITNTSAIGLSAAGLPPYGSLTSPDGVLLTWNGAAITTGGGSSASNWSFYPQQSNLATFTATQISTASLGVSTINGSPFVATSNWSQYFANSDVQLDGRTLFGGTDCNMNIVGQNGNTNLISQQSNVNIISQSGSVNISSYTSANVNATDVLIKAQTYSPINTPTVTVESRGGPLGGNVTLAAYAGNVPTEAAVGFGRVSLQAYGSSNAELNLGGLIDITAYSGSLPITLLTGTSALRMNAAAVNMSAGYVNALPSFAGSWTAYATNIASIVTGPIPSVFPQIPGTVYIYGFGAVRLDSAGPIQCLAPLETTFLQVDSITGSSSNVGTYFANPLTASVITPSPILGAVPGQDLYIRGSNAVIGPLNISTFIRLEDVRYCAFMSQGGAIGNLSSINNFTVTPDSLSGLSSLSISTINGYQFPQVAPAFSSISTFVDLYASEFHVSSIVALNSTIDIAAPVGVGLITAGDIANGGFLDINNQNTISTLNFAALGNDVGGTYLGGNTNTDFSYLWLNKDGAAGVELVAPRSNVIISAESTIALSSAYVDITATTGMILTAPSTITFSTPVVDVTGGDINNITNIRGVAGSPFTVYSSGDIALEASVDAYVEALGGSANLNGSVDANIAATTGGVNITGPAGIQLNSSTIIGSVGAPVGLNVYGTMNATGDVVANSAGSFPYSLSTVYGLVKGNQQYNYWVSVNGSDITGTGSAVAPFATISNALAVTNAIADGIPVNINIAAGTYTENPTIIRNNTFLIGPAGVSDVIIIGTLTLNPGATAETLVTMGASFVTVVGSVVCTDTTNVEVNWFLTNVNVTSYGVAAVACTGDTVNNCSITLNNCILTQNVTNNACLLLTSCRANLVLVSIAQNTTAPCISFVGNASIAANGATFTAAGSATASPIIFFANTISAGSLNTFTSCSFIYTASTVGVGKTGVSFNNAVAANAVFNYCVFSVGGSTNIIVKNGIGTTNVTWGHNTCTSVSTVPATSATLTYSYSAQDFIRANTLRDSANSAGTANQVLTAGAGAGLTWASLGASSLGALAATPAATAYQNSLTMFNTTTNTLSYDTPAYGFQVTAISGVSLAVNPAQRGRTFILTSAAGGGSQAIAVGPTFGINDTNFFCIFKNGNGSSGGDITLNGVAGNNVIHNQTALQNGQQIVVIYDGTRFVGY